MAGSFVYSLLFNRIDRTINRKERKLLQCITTLALFRVPKHLEDLLTQSISAKVFTKNVHTERTSLYLILLACHLNYRTRAPLIAALEL